MTSKRSRAAWPIAFLFALVGCTTPGTTSTPTPAAASDLGDCKAQLGPFLATLTELHSRLTVGLPFADYSQKVGDAKVAYDALDTSALASGCASGVGVPAEKALNSYTYAYDTWNNCIQAAATGCTLESIQSRLQGNWTEAEKQIDAAKKALAAAP